MLLIVILVCFSKKSLLPYAPLLLGKVAVMWTSLSSSESVAIGEASGYELLSCLDVFKQDLTVLMTILTSCLPLTNKDML